MKVTYNVICSVDKKHKFPVVYDMEPNTTHETSTSTEFCPFCGASIQVTIVGKIKNKELIRSFGFDLSDDK